MTSFATELATPNVTDVRYVRTDALLRLIYKDHISNEMQNIENFGRMFRLFNLSTVAEPERMA